MLADTKPVTKKRMLNSDTLTEIIQAFIDVRRNPS